MDLSIRKNYVIITDGMEISMSTEEALKLYDLLRAQFVKKNWVEILETENMGISNAGTRYFNAVAAYRQEFGATLKAAKGVIDEHLRAAGWRLAGGPNSWYKVDKDPDDIEYVDE
jgi:hypothetical protein